MTRFRYIGTQTISVRDARTINTRYDQMCTSDQDTSYPFGNGHSIFFLNHFADDVLRKCDIFRCVLAHGSVTVILCSAFRRRMKKKTSRKYQFSRFGTYLRSIVIVSAPARPSTRHIHLYLSLSLFLSHARTHTYTHS